LELVHPLLQPTPEQIGRPELHSPMDSNGAQQKPYYIEATHVSHKYEMKYPKPTLGQSSTAAENTHKVQHQGHVDLQNEC